MKKILKALLRTTVGKTLLSIHLEIFIDFLKQKTIEKYGAASDRTQYIILFLDSLSADLMDFLSKDFMLLKEKKDVEAVMMARAKEEYEGQRRALKSINTKS